MDIEKTEKTFEVSAYLTAIARSSCPDDPQQQILALRAAANMIEGEVNAEFTAKVMFNTLKGIKL